LMTRVMRRGTSSRTAEEINREIEFLGTQIGTPVHADFFGFELSILGKNFRKGLELLADVVLNPSFPEEGIREEKHLQIASIRKSLDSSVQRPLQLLLRTFYGNHPYAIPMDGFPNTVEAVDRDSLIEWWKGWAVLNDALIVIVGDITTEAARELVESCFGGLRRRETEAPPVPGVILPDARIETVEYRDRKQSAIAVAYPTVPMNHEDWPKLKLLQNVTSGLAGTFFAELRGKRSLAYTVFAGESSRRLAGLFLGYLASDVSKERRAKDALIAEFKRLDEDGFSEEDLERAKAYFAGSTKISLQTNASHVDDLAEAWMYDLGLDFTKRLLERVEAITIGELRDVATKYLDHDSYTVAIVSGSSKRN
ncbi:MAG: pitrilysin family protein, partial [Thermoanaerobaculia bacterium]|nr:pitrilysin family protein [Thermoanaerobaculia bacterium]